MSYLCNSHVYACKIMFVLFLVFQARCRHRLDFSFATGSWCVDSSHARCPPIVKMNAFVKLFKEVPYSLDSPPHHWTLSFVTMTSVPKEVLWDFLQPSINEFVVLLYVDMFLCTWLHTYCCMNITSFIRWIYKSNLCEK